MLPTKDILLVLAVLSAGSSLVDGRVHGGGGSEIRKKHRTEHLHHLQDVVAVGQPVKGIGGHLHGDRGGVVEQVELVLRPEEDNFDGDEGDMGCLSCADRELFKNFTREEVKEKILRKLGMIAPPNVTTEAVPEHLLNRLLNRFQRDFEVQGDDPEAGTEAGAEDGSPGALPGDDDDYHFQTRQINVIAKEPVSGEVPPPLLDLWEIQYFDMDTPLLRDSWREVTKANLWLHMPKAPSADDTHAYINVYYVSIDKNDHAFLTQEKSTRVKLRQNGGGWVELNLWEIVNLWFKNPNENLGIVIKVNTSTQQELKVGVQSQPKAAPFLQLDIRKSGAGNRWRRTVNKVCTEENDMNETHCCLWDYTINFKEDYGWDWIIHPKEYKANFCQGECSYHTMMPSNSYAHLMAQAKGKSCCAPQKMSSINMLYFSEDMTVILGRLPNMKVDRCGCA